MSTFLSVLFTNYRQAGSAPFVMFYTPRTGSNLLAALLDSHPSILCHHELFNPEAPHVSLSVRDGAEPFDFGTSQERDANPKAFLKRVYAENRDASSVGFKLCITESPSSFWGLLFNRGVKKIFVGRRNTLESLVSALIAERKQEWIDFAAAGKQASDDKATVTSVDVDLAQFKSYSRKRRIYMTLMKVVERLTFQRFIWTDFEDVVQRSRVDDLIGELGLEACSELQEKTRRQNPAPLSEKIANFDEVRAALTGTSDAWMLQLPADQGTAGAA